MTAHSKPTLVLVIVTVISIVMVSVVLALELRFGTARAWTNGVQLPEALAVFIKTCGVLHALPIITTGLVATMRAASHRDTPDTLRSLACIYLVMFLISCLVFSLVLVWRY